MFLDKLLIYLYKYYVDFQIYIALWNPPVQEYILQERRKYLQEEEERKEMFIRW